MGDSASVNSHLVMTRARGVGLWWLPGWGGGRLVSGAGSRRQGGRREACDISSKSYTATFRHSAIHATGQFLLPNADASPPARCRRHRRLLTPTKPDQTRPIAQRRATHQAQRNAPAPVRLGQAVHRARRQDAHQLVEGLEGVALVELDVERSDVDEVRGEGGVVVGVVPWGWGLGLELGVGVKW